MHTRTRSTLVCCGFVTVVGALETATARAQCPPGWRSAGAHGLDGAGHAAVRWDPDDEGPQPAQLVIGGVFHVAGTVRSTAVAAWDGVDWISLQGGVSGSSATTVNALAVFDDGSGPAVYVGGHFFFAGNTPVNCIAKWDGANWSPLGSGLNDAVYSLAVYDDGSGPALIAGGRFTQAGGNPASRIAKWTGTAWSALGAGVNNDVLAIYSFNPGDRSYLYVGGRFSFAGTLAARRFVRWDGAAWSYPGMEFENGEVRAITAFDDGEGAALYVGGSFTAMASGPARYVVRSNGAAWLNLGGGPNAPVDALLPYAGADGDCLVVGGEFFGVDGIAAEGVARWSGTQWSPAADGINGRVRALAAVEIDGPNGAAALCAVGSFSTHALPNSDNVARLGPDTWSGFSSAYRWAPINALAAFDAGSGPALYAGGDFRAIRGAPGDHIARLTPNGWEAVSGGCDGPVHTMMRYDDGLEPALIVGGRFLNAGGVDVNRLARWNGTNWSRLGVGATSSTTAIYALAAFDDGISQKIYVGGAFSGVGGSGGNNIARLDGTLWQALPGGGTNGVVYAIAEFDEGSGPALYVGGSFSAPGANIARWNGATWSNVGLGCDAAVHALTVFDDGAGPALYVGGTFATAGGGPHTGVARWNGRGWRSAGAGLEGGGVYCFTTYDDGAGIALYAGGSFFVSGGVPVNCIARWNGVRWAALAEGISGLSPGDIVRVRALAEWNDGPNPALCAGGSFSAAGTLGANNLAWWQRVCPRGDLDCDAAVTLFDIDPFIQALLDPSGYDNSHPECDRMNADMNADDAVNFFDIDPFVACVLGACS